MCDPDKTPERPQCMPRTRLAALLSFCSRMVPVAILFATFAAHAEGIARFETIGEKLVVTPHVRHVVEDSGPLTPQEAAARLSEAPTYGGDSEWLELGLMQATVWIAVTIQNLSDDEHLVFEFRNPRMSYVDFYFPDGKGDYAITQCGLVRPFYVRPFHYPMPAFPFTLQKGETVTVLLRLENNGDFRQRVWLWDSVAFTNRAVTAYLGDMMTTGILAVLAIFQLLVFLLLREKSYLYLCLFVTSWALFLMAATGMGKMFLWQDFPWFTLRVNSFFLVCMSIFFVLFTMSYLDVRKITPLLYKVGCVFVGLCVAYLIYICLVDSLLRMRLNQFLMTGTLVVLFALTAGALWRGSRNAKFFLYAWGFMLSACLILMLVGWYALPTGIVLGTPIISILFTVSMLLWSLELIGRVRVRNREQRRLLEAQVQERTKELQKALNEVKTLSGLLPICSSCKKIRDDKGYWNSVEYYIGLHTDADFTHGICPECTDALYPEVIEIRRKRAENQANEANPPTDIY